MVAIFLVTILVESIFRFFDNWLDFFDESMYMISRRAVGGVLDAREVCAYPTWYAQLGVLSRRPGWMSPLRDLVG